MRLPTPVRRFLTRHVRVYREDLIHYGEIYMRRYVCRFGAVGEVRLHHIRTPDGARQHLHDHPFTFVSVLLRGWYTHRVQYSPPAGPTTDVRRRWLSVCRMPLDAAHTITEVGPGGAWTLVVTGRKRADRDNKQRQSAWGFWVDGKFEPAREHFEKHPHRADFGARIVTYIGGESSATDSDHDDPGFTTIPSRYNQHGRETIDLIRDTMSDAEFAGYCNGNAIKYELRRGAKGGPDDEKARWYRMMLAHVEQPEHYPDPRHERPGFTPYVRQPARNIP